MLNGRCDFCRANVVFLAHENLAAFYCFSWRRIFSPMSALAATTLIECARANLLIRAARIATLTAIVLG